MCPPVGSLALPAAASAVGSNFQGTCAPKPHVGRTTPTAHLSAQQLAGSGCCARPSGPRVPAASQLPHPVATQHHQAQNFLCLYRLVPGQVGLFEGSTLKWFGDVIRQMLARCCLNCFCSLSLDTMALSSKPFPVASLPCVRPRDFLTALPPTLLRGSRSGLLYFRLSLRSCFVLWLLPPLHAQRLPSSELGIRGVAQRTAGHTGLKRTRRLTSTLNCVCWEKNGKAIHCVIKIGTKTSL